MVLHRHAKPRDPACPDVLHEAEELAVGRQGIALLPPFTADFGPGELIVVFGPNGAGKSTLLGTLSGGLAPVSGQHRVAAGVERSGMLQAPSLSPQIPTTVHSLIAAGIDTRWSFLRPFIPASSTQRVAAWIARFELDALARRSFHRLSGGQQQRAFLARTLVCEARFVLLDEPTSAMDVSSKRLTYEILRTYAEELGASVLVATHDVVPAFAYAHRAVYVDKDAGVLIDGTIGEIAHHAAVRARYGDALEHRMHRRDW